MSRLLTTGILQQASNNSVGSFLLDLYPALFGISNRQLKSGITDVINVREGLGNTLQSFTPTEITDGTLTTFTGANDGLVRQPIDQASGLIVEQTTNASQPEIVNSGNLVTSGGLPAWDNNGKFGWKTTQNLALSGQSEVWLFSVVDFSSGANQHISLFGDAVTGELSAFRIFVVSDIVVIAQATNNTGTNSFFLAGNTPLVSGNRYLITARLKSNTAWATAYNVYINGISQANTSTFGQNPTVGFLDKKMHVLNDNNSNEWNSKAQELIVMVGDQSANRVGIEADINAYYNIY